MLRKINEGGVESVNGFSIQIIGPEILEYRYKGKRIEIALGYEPKERRVYIHATECNEFYGDDKKQMISNIKEAVKLLNGNFEFI